MRYVVKTRKTKRGYVVWELVERTSGKVVSTRVSRIA
jgi:hypothetical protein